MCIRDSWCTNVNSYWSHLMHWHHPVPVPLSSFLCRFFFFIFPCLTPWVLFSFPVSFFFFFIFRFLAPLFFFLFSVPVSFFLFLVFLTCVLMLVSCNHLTFLFPTFLYSFPISSLLLFIFSFLVSYSVVLFFPFPLIFCCFLFVFPCPSLASCCFISCLLFPSPFLLCRCLSPLPVYLSLLLVSLPRALLALRTCFMFSFLLANWFFFSRFFFPLSCFRRPCRYR